jgi:DNA-binding NarL/FixJ family response regulator
LDESGVLRVVIAEDNYLVREGVRRLLEDSGEVDVVAGTGNATELLDAVRRLNPDAVLTDIRMPPGHHMEGIEAARAIRVAHPDIGVVVLSQHADESYALALFADGSAGLGYLLKDRIGDLEDLVHALREVRAGGSVIDPQIVDTLVRRRSAGAASPLAGLSPRELDVLGLTAMEWRPARAQEARRIVKRPNSAPSRRAASCADLRPRSASAVARFGRKAIDVISVIPVQRSQSSK